MEGHKSCFKESLDYISKYDLKDSKGLKGDEYYLCAAIQKCKTQVIPIDYSKLKFVKIVEQILRLKITK